MNQIVIGENIVKAFGEGEEQCKVLNGVFVKIKEGEFVSVMGPSGSGKSTLLYTLSGVDGIDEGRVIFEGRDLSSIKERELSDIRRNKMGFVFQQPTMLKNLNLLDNIIYPSVHGNKKNIAVIIKKATELMKKAGIDGLEKRDITQVSGGQLQRAGICRALMNNPKIMFGDEPTGALNSQTAQDIMELFHDINKEGTAIMLVTHDAKVAACTERIMFMRDGRIESELELSRYDGGNMDSRIEKVTAKMRELGI